jgi:hypothetical protein
MAIAKSTNKGPKYCPAALYPTLKKPSNTTRRGKITGGIKQGAQSIFLVFLLFTIKEKIISRV